MSCNNNPRNNKTNEYIKWNFYFSLLKTTTIVIIVEAKSMRYQTKSKASKEISFPRIAVNPQIKQ